MAIIKCPECGKEISDAVQACPGCGFPIKKHKKVSPKIFGIIGLLLIFVVGVGIIISLNQLDEKEKEDVSHVCNIISELGEVSSSSDADIVKAEKLYESLSKKCQRHVNNYEKLVEARETYDKLKAEDTIKLISEIGEVTIDKQNAIDKAQKSYDSLTEEQKQLVKNADDLKAAKEQISSLKIEDVCEKIEKIGNVNLKSQGNIEIARKSYEKLSNDEKNKVSNYRDLIVAEEEYNGLAVEECISLINSIGKVTLDSKEKIDKANKLYDSFSKEVQDKVTNYDILEKASSKYKKLKQQEDERKRTLNPGNKFKTDKWEIIYNKTNITAKIQPNNTSGYYIYYYANDDETFIDIVFQIKNIDTDILGIEDLISDCKVKYDGSNLTKSYNLYTSDGSRIQNVYSWNGLDALDSTTLHVAITMPREIQSNKKSIIVNLTIAGEEKIICVR